MSESNNENANLESSTSNLLKQAQAFVRKREEKERALPSDEISAVMHPDWLSRPAPLRIYWNNPLRPCPIKQDGGTGDEAQEECFPRFESGDLGKSPPNDHLVEFRADLNWASTFTFVVSPELQEAIRNFLNTKSGITLRDVRFECVEIKSLSQDENGDLVVQASFFFSTDDDWDNADTSTLKKNLVQAYQHVLLEYDESPVQLTFGDDYFTLKQFTAVELVVGPKGKLLFPPTSVGIKSPGIKRGDEFRMTFCETSAPYRWEMDALENGARSIPKPGIYDAQVTGISANRSKPETNKITHIWMQWRIKGGPLVSQVFHLEDPQTGHHFQQMLWGWLGTKLQQGDLHLDSLVGKLCQIVIRRAIWKGFYGFYYELDGVKGLQTEKGIKWSPEVVVVLPADSKVGHGLVAADLEPRQLVMY